MRLIFRLSLTIIFLCGLPQTGLAQMLIGYGPSPGKKEEGAKVEISADQLTNEEKTGNVIASGNVIIDYDTRTLRADRVSYAVSEDRITASGNVVLTTIEGDQYFADELMLEDRLRNGVIEALEAKLIDGSYIRADRAKRESGTKTELENAFYTPCKLCEDQDPVWNITADNVTYNEAENRISYENAQFEILGVPVAWLPRFSHTDGKAKQKSGLLAPSFGFDSQLGTTLLSRYYWAIADDRDATVGVLATSQELPVLFTEYRQRFQNASLLLDGSITSSSRTDSIGGQDVGLDEETRGHVFGEGRWDINDKWRSGFDLELTSDEQYLRQYDIPSNDVLETQLFVERFSGRDYAVARALAFQDIRVAENRVDQPNVLPEILANFTGEPDSFLGGRLALDLSFLGISRDGNGQDLMRGSSALEWQKRFISATGLTSTLDLSVRGDVYSVTDPQAAVDDNTDFRFFPQAHWLVSYPLAKPLSNGQYFLEPTVSLTAGSNIENNEFPNEDSQDIQLDPSNLFQAQRFTGLDRIEDETRITYGLRQGYNGNDGKRFSFFIGQSYRFDDENDPIFPGGSGLERQESDFVGQVTSSWADALTLDYRFQIASDNLSGQRHEVDAFSILGPVRFSTRYLFARTLEGTDIINNREQIAGGAAFDITDQWRIRSGALYDLGENSGLRRTVFGLDYTNDCLLLSLTTERNLTRDSSGDSGTEIMVRVGLKNIGEVESGNTGFDPLTPQL